MKTVNVPRLLDRSVTVVNNGVEPITVNGQEVKPGATWYDDAVVMRPDDPIFAYLSKLMKNGRRRA